MQLADNLNNLGTETAFEVLARAAKLAAAGKDVINLGIGQPDFKTHQARRFALQLQCLPKASSQEQRQTG